MKTDTRQNRNISVLIPDGESHLLLYVVNSLAEEKQVDIYVMSNTKRIPMRYSRHIKSFAYAKTNSDLDWIDAINTEVEKHNIDVIMPIFETRIKTLIEHKSKIIKQDKIGLLPSLDNYKTAFNKDKLTKHLEANTLPFAKSIIVSSQLDFRKVNDLNFPLIIKPLEGFGGGQGIYKFDSSEQLKVHFEKNTIDYKNILQEYIEGYDIDCSVLCKAGEILAFTMQKGNMIGKNQFSPQFGLQFLYEDELYKVVEKLIKSLDWSGVAHIDLRYDENTNTFKVVEINTRFWVSLEASLIAGVNFPYLYALSSIGKTYDKPKYEFLEYLNLKGLIRKIKRDKKFVFKTKFLLNNTPLKFTTKDPVPTLYKFIWRTKNIMMSRRKKYTFKKD